MNDELTITRRQPVQGQGVASMVLGILSIIFCFAGLLTLAGVVLAIVFGARSLNTSTRGMGIAGLVCGMVGGLAYLIFGIATLGVGFFL